MYLLRMPKADENMGEGTVSRWFVAEGARVEKGQDLVECIADKGEFLVYSEVSGVLRRICAPERSVVPVGYVLAAIGGEEEPLPDVEAENSRILAKAREDLLGAGEAATRTDGTGPPGPVRSGEVGSPSASPSSAILATPAARTLARELGVRLEDIASFLEGSGRGGQVVREQDVRRFAAQKRGPRG